MKIKATLLHMAANEIKAMIPPYQFDEIKRRDAKPLFKAFVVGQEGKAEATMLGVGKVVKTWFADAIGKLARKIWPGMRLFHNHAETNDTEGREAIGEVAGTRTKTIDGKFSAVIAAYIYPEYRNMPLNVASIEADINVESGDIHGDVHALDVDDVSAIALGDKAENLPGFPGATLLGSLQAFAVKDKSNEGEETLELKDIKKFLKDEGIDPSEVFTKAQLIADSVVESHVEAERKDAGTGEHKHRERTDKKFDEARAEWEEKDKAKDAEILTLKKEGAKTKASELFEKKLIERKLNEKQSEFLKDEQKEFEVDDPEKVEKEIDTFMDAGLEKYKTKAKIFGIEDETVDLPPGSEPTEGRTGATDGLLPG